MFHRNRFNLGAFLMLAMALLVPSLAMATPPAGEYDGVITAIGDAATPIGAIGAAVLLVLVGIKVLKWVRRAF